MSAPEVTGGAPGVTGGAPGVTRRLRRGERVVLASHNAGKLAEIADLLAPYGLAVVSAGALGLGEPVEDAPDFVGNARIKAVAAAVASGLPALADDSGLCVASLGGAPGVLSARWAGPEKDFGAAIARVEREVAAAGERPGGAAAWFVSALCLAWPDGGAETMQGRVDGVLVFPPAGGLGFGYDPIFRPDGSALTYGQTDRATKQASSHRARAFALLVARCLPEPGLALKQED